jgi:hypothetical protein
MGRPTSCVETSLWDGSTADSIETEAGFEPAYTVVQTVPSPLGHTVMSALDWTRTSAERLGVMRMTGGAQTSSPAVLEIAVQPAAPHPYVGVQTKKPPCPEVPGGRLRLASVC